MYVTSENNRDLSLRFVQGKPSERLLWSFMLPGIVELAKSLGYEEYWQLGHNRLGWLNFCCPISPFKVFNDNLKIIDTPDGGFVKREYQSTHGILHELRMNNEIVEHRIKTETDLDILINTLLDTRIEAETERYSYHKRRHEPFMAIAAQTDTASACQQFLQYEFGVMNFYYLLNDYPDKMEECMNIYQGLLAQKYKFMQNAECDFFYQGENTSTSLISPEYYAKYGVPQVKQFVDAAHAVNKRAIVHMCGLLHELLPLIKSTGMDGIHALTPPDTGNVPFQEIYKIMPSACSVLGRFGSLEWIGKNAGQIKVNLRRLLPHDVYQKHPFVLLVSSDGAPYTIDDLCNVRDAINDYEQEGI